MRHFITKLMVSLMLILIAGCGFHLRGITQVPNELKTLMLESYDPYGPLTRAVREQLRLNGVTVSNDHMRKDIPSLRIVSSTETQDTVSIFRDGKTAEYQLVLTINAQVLIPGHNIYPLNARVFRSFFDNPLTALAKDSEQDIILQEMREQAAQQLVRKLITVHAAEVAEEKAEKKAPKTVISP